jgi:hypothetical protein
MTLMLTRTQWMGEEWLGDRIENRESAIGSSCLGAVGCGGLPQHYWVISSDYLITEGVRLVRRNSEADFIEGAGQLLGRILYGSPTP